MCAACASGSSHFGCLSGLGVTLPAWPSVGWGICWRPGLRLPFAPLPPLLEVDLESLVPGWGWWQGPLDLRWSGVVEAGSLRPLVVGSQSSLVPSPCTLGPAGQVQTKAQWSAQIPQWLGCLLLIRLAR